MRRALFVGLLTMALLGCNDAAEELGEIDVIGPFVVSPDGRSIAMGLGTCFDGEATVEESPQEVRLHAEGHLDGPLDDCGWNPVRVELDRPLGDRRLVNDHRDSEVRPALCHRDAGVTTDDPEARFIERVCADLTEPGGPITPD